MIKINGTDKKEDIFLCEAHDESGKKIRLNASTVNSPYLSPRQLLETSVAGCLYITVKRILTEKEMCFHDVTVSVAMDNQNGKTSFKTDIEITGIKEALKQSIIREAYCRSFVKNALSQPIHFI